VRLPLIVAIEKSRGAASEEYAKPSLLKVEDDREVLRAIERGLAQPVRDRYRVICVGIPEAPAFLHSRELKTRNNPVACARTHAHAPDGRVNFHRPKKWR